ncbi:SDR family NAD(P)-dependent oxidoreductase [Mesorhizobium sp. ANAO-SY3R2]|uniref:SDR family NAD(P)-dependent oxidoreductase n=1 Tax=Mesorhizobium sp. ANAO-SY3R2 TaxID=3166644 RepID=UPI00367193A5
MSPAINDEPSGRERELRGQTVVVIGGSSGIGLETARRVRTEGADVIVTWRDRQRLEQAARAVGTEHVAAFDANDAPSLQSFFHNLFGGLASATRLPSVRLDGLMRR